MSVANCLFFYFFLVLICSALFVSLFSDLDIFVFTKDRFSVMFIIDLCLIILFCFVFFFSGICSVRYFLFNPRSLLLEDKERAGRKRLVALKEKLKKKSGGKLNSGLGWLSLNQNQINYNGQSKEREMLKSQWELKTKTTKLPKARENAGDQVVIGVSFASDWLREWREFSEPSSE